MSTDFATSPALAARSGLRVRITGVHASILILLGTGFSLNALAGGLAGLGMYPWLQTNHLAAVGLLQAYLLMAVVGAAVLVGFATSRPLPRAWHWLAIVAHLPPLLSVAVFAPSTPAMTLPFIMASIVIHFTGIGAEALALSRKD
jgi:hypothetical protein